MEDETEINKVIDALLKKCNEYNKLHDATMCYNKGDKIVFKLPDKEYHYHVSKSIDDIHWFLANEDKIGYNDQIIDALNITNKERFCRDVSECDISSESFPEIKCPDSTGISKVINKLMEMCEEKMKESLKTEEKVSTETTSQKPSSKVSDFVRVISKETVLKKSTLKYKLKFTN